MSNDTDVYAILNSDSKTNLLAAVAYLGNKDRTWRLDVDEVRGNKKSGYFVRLYGWANENSLGNIWITGESGELSDLSRKFPDIEIDGWYRDEYSSGPLYEGEKSYENSHGDEGEGLSVEIEVGSLRKVKIGLSDAIDLLVNAIDKNGSIGYIEYHGHSVSDDENEPPEMNFSIENDIGMEESEICNRLCEILRTWMAPKDFTVKIMGYHGDVLFESKVWQDDYISFKQVSSEDAENFIENLTGICEVSPEELLDRLSELSERDLSLKDDDENTVLHLAAEKGLINQVHSDLLNLSNLIRKNNIGECPISLAHDHGHSYQLPDDYRDPNFCRDYERKNFIENLMSKGQEELARHIIANFPNPLLTD